MASTEEALAEARGAARRLYPRWSPEDRKDLVQEVMQRYLRATADGRKPDNLAAWLTTVTRNTARNLHAARDRRPEHPVAGDDPLGPLVDLMSTQLASLMPVREDLLDRVLELLPDERTRTVLRYKYLDNLSSREIGEELGMEPNTVDQVASRGKRQLREALASRPDLVEELRRAHPRNY